MKFSVPILLLRGSTVERFPYCLPDHRPQCIQAPLKCTGALYVGGTLNLLKRLPLAFFAVQVNDELCQKQQEHTEAIVTLENVTKGFHAN